MRKWIKGFRKRARLRVGKLLSLKKKGALSRHRAKSVQPWRIAHYCDEIISAARHAAHRIHRALEGHLPHHFRGQEPPGLVVRRLL